MTAAVQNIVLEQGADFQQVFQIADPAITTAELSGASAVMQLRTAFGDAVATLTLSTADGSLSINASTREITASAGWATTETLLAGNGVYDIKMLTASGKHRRTHQGGFVISPAVTLAEPPSSPPASYGQFDFSKPSNSMILAAAM